MPANKIMDFLSVHTEIDHRLRFQLAFQCAPVMKSIKASNIIVVANRFYDKLKSVLKGTGIRYILLCQGKGKCVLLLYRYQMLVKHLNKMESREFLKKYGYNSMDIKFMFHQLIERYQKYYMEKEEFPHELGVFLEYPIKDVIGFIENNGRDCMLSGYWKVYHQPLQAQEIFDRYDEAKDEALNEVFSGKSISDIVNAYQQINQCYSMA